MYLKLSSFHSLLTPHRVHEPPGFRAKSEELAQYYRSQKTKLVNVLRRLMKALSVRMRSNWKLFEAICKWKYHCIHTRTEVHRNQIGAYAW